MTCIAMIFNKLSNYTTLRRPYVRPQEWCVYHRFVLMSISVHRIYMCNTRRMFCTGVLVYLHSCNMVTPARCHRTTMYEK